QHGTSTSAAGGKNKAHDDHGDLLLVLARFSERLAWLREHEISKSCPILVVNRGFEEQHLKSLVEDLLVIPHDEVDEAEVQQHQDLPHSSTSSSQLLMETSVDTRSTRIASARMQQKALLEGLRQDSQELTSMRLQMQEQASSEEGRAGEDMLLNSMNVVSGKKIFRIQGPHLTSARRKTSRSAIKCKGNNKKKNARKVEPPGATTVVGELGELKRRGHPVFVSNLAYNRGREVAVYLSFISQNYETLPKYLALLQAEPAYTSSGGTYAKVADDLRRLQGLAAAATDQPQSRPDLVAGNNTPQQAGAQPHQARHSNIDNKKDQPVNNHWKDTEKELNEDGFSYFSGDYVGRNRAADWRYNETDKSDSGGGFQLWNGWMSFLNFAASATSSTRTTRAGSQTMEADMGFL
ncbi:unnamed protein product, partial [Amoebophrya sp. A25]